MEKIERTGEFICPEYLIDSFGHVYNGYYTELVRLLLIKEDLIPHIEDYLKIHDFSFERFLRRETIKYKKEITCQNPINYTIGLDPSAQKLRVHCKLCISNCIEATQIELSFGNKQKCQSKPGNEWFLVGKEKLLHPIFPDYKDGLLSVQIYKSLFEVARGKFLSIALQGDKNYFGMLSSQNIAFISSSSTVKYYQEIKLGEFFEVKTYRKPEKSAVRIQFFQDLINMKKEVVARITTDIVQIDIVKKRPQSTDFRSKNIRYRILLLFSTIDFSQRIVGKKITKLWKSIRLKMKPFLLHFKKIFSPKKKKPRKTQGISLGLSHKRACIRTSLSLQSTGYLFVSHIVWL